jgi:hypothetical protein
MDSELVNLQRRVAELEAALAAISSESRQPKLRRRAALAPLICVGILAVCVLILLVRGVGPSVTAQGGSTGPSKVVAPFQVVDGKGQLLFSVQAEDSGGGGAAFIFTNAGIPAAEMLATQSGNGQLRIMHNGATKISLGISTASDAGSILLFSNSQAETIIHGGVGIQQKNAQGQPVAQLGADDNGQGYAMAANRAGTYLSKISVAADGSSGRVEVSQGSDIKVLMGVLENGKGDVCAHGDPGKQVCLSGLAVKSLIRY